jgi:cob(I)alamin adenosyltransferase
MNILFFCVLFVAQVCFTLDNNPKQHINVPTYNSYDEAIAKIFKGVSLIGASPLSTIMIQQMSAEKKQHIEAISQGQTKSEHIKPEMAKYILTRIDCYNKTVNYYLANIKNLE